MLPNRKRRFLLITTLLGTFWAAYNFTSVNVAIPTIAMEFNASASSASWIITSTLLVTSMVVLPVGRLSDLHGRKKTLFYGVIILTIATILCALASSVTMLVIFRGILGIGGAMVATSIIAIISSAFPVQSRGKVLGINIAFTYMGLSASPFISGWIIQQFGWRYIYYFTFPIGLLLLWMISRIKDEWKAEEKVHLDYTGAWIYALGILSIIWGLINLTDNKIGPAVLFIGIALMVIFGRFEMRTKIPLIDIRTLKSNRVLIFATLASFINYGSTYAISFMMSLYLQYIHGFDPGYTGTILLVQPAVQSLFSPFAGFLSDRVDPRYVASSGMAIITACLFLLSGFDQNTPVWNMVIIFAFIGIGFALFSSPNTNSIMSSMDPNQYGIASGILSTARTVGQSFSMAITALIISLYIGSQSIYTAEKAAFSQSFRTTFLLFSFFCFIGVLASMARGKKENVI